MQLSHIQDKVSWGFAAEFYELLAKTLVYPEQKDPEKGSGIGAALADGSYIQAAHDISFHVMSHDHQVQEYIAAIEKMYGAFSPEEALHHMRIEYTRLFIGTVHPLVWPYATWWYAKKEGKEPVLYLSKECRSVSKIMHDAGVGNAPGLKEPLDHIGCELEFLQYLCSLCAEMQSDTPKAVDYGSMYETFLDQHIRPWVGDFAYEVQKETSDPLFLFAAELLRNLV